MSEIKLIDFKGDYWHLIYDGAARYLHEGGAHFKAWWYIVEGPKFLNENGAQYSEISTPIFTEWF